MQNRNTAIKKYKRFKEKDWLNIVREYEQSDLNMRQFCDARQISSNSLSNWKYKFKKQQHDAASRAKTAIVNFVPVKIDTELKYDGESELVSGAGNSELKIELRSSVRIIVPNNFDDQQLLRLINLLQ